MTASANRPRDRAFDNPACLRCGECFHLCPELHLPKDVAKREIEALRSGRDGDFVLQHCTSCFSCNLNCPNGCEPYQLILENWNRIYKQRGAPPIYRFMCPASEGSIFQMLHKLMPEADRQLVEAWMNREPGETVLLIGNYTHLYPFILGNSRLLSYFTPVDLLDHWEVGATLYQGGYLDVVRRIGCKCKQELDAWNVKTVVPLLDAVHHMLSTVQPQEMGVTFNQRILNFNEWLLETIDSGEIALPERLNMKIALHDNCFSKAGGDTCWNRARELIRRTGCEIAEMQHNRGDSRCCGFGAGASWESNRNIPFDIFRISRKKLEEAEATGADALVTYCSGCLYLLCAARELFQSDLKVYHHIELVRMAMGEDADAAPERRSRRAWDVIAIITYHMVSGLFRRPFEIRELSFGEQRWAERRFTLLRLLRKILDTRVGRTAYRKITLLLLPLLARRKPEFDATGAET
jgi:Fe-S oxidoreductase